MKLRIIGVALLVAVLAALVPAAVAADDDPGGDIFEGVTEGLPGTADFIGDWTVSGTVVRHVEHRNRAGGRCGRRRRRDADRARGTAVPRLDRPGVRFLPAERFDQGRPGRGPELTSDPRANGGVDWAPPLRRV